MVKDHLTVSRNLTYRIKILIATQTLELWRDNQIVKKYLISSAKNGVGEEYGSFKTPRGLHVIRAKIGKNLPMNAVLVRRRWTQEIYKPELKIQYQERDWILTRILWLCGVEPGKNGFGICDRM